MTVRALKLIAKVLSLKEPPRSLVYSIRNKIDVWLGNEDRRFIFEKLYLEKGDIWNYETSDYERTKYGQTMDRIVALRSSKESVLEVGCSVGVFTEMLAAQFEQVTAIDISQEALAIAERRHYRPNISYVRSGIRELSATSRYDVIICAEILYHIPEGDAARVVDKLANLLSDQGVLVAVFGFTDSTEARYFDVWNDALTKRFKRLALDHFEHSSRPYRIAAFATDRASGRTHS